MTTITPDYIFGHRTEALKIEPGVLNVCHVFMVVMALAFLVEFRPCLLKVEGEVSVCKMGLSAECVIDDVCGARVARDYQAQEIYQRLFIRKIVVMRRHAYGRSSSQLLMSEKRKNIKILSIRCLLFNILLVCLREHTIIGKKNATYT